MSERQWYIVIPQKAQGNFHTARQAGVWGARDAGSFNDKVFGPIQAGDRVHFLSGLKWASSSPQPQAFPRVPLDQYEVAASMHVVAKATSDIQDDSRRIWSDDVYPVRFQFQVEAEDQDTRFTSDTTSDAIRDAVRKSHSGRGKAYAVAAEESRQARAFSLHSAIERIMSEYPQARHESFTSHPLAHFLSQEVPPGLSTWPVVQTRSYMVKGSAGQGVWAQSPWIAVLDPTVTRSVQSGHYVVYLFSADMERVYLTLGFGVTGTGSGSEPRARRAAIRESITLMRNALTFNGMTADDTLRVADRGLGNQYQDATVAYTAYERGHLPADEVLEQDLARALRYYDEMTAVIQREDPAGHAHEAQPPYPDPEASMAFEVPEAISRMGEMGYRLAPKHLANILLCLEIRPFVIFSGRSGTGKTSLSRLLSYLFGWPYYHVAVSPAWADPSDLLGYLSPMSNKRVAGALDALLTESRPHALLCLDEFNIAKVEHYFSDFISAMDAGDTSFWAEPATLRSLNDNAARVGEGERLRMPQTLRVIATMNFDDSVQSITPRVLDRANLIEFDVTHADELLLDQALDWSQAVGWPRHQWPLPVSSDGPHPEVAATIRQVWQALYTSRGQFGHRVAQEISRYVEMGCAWGEVFGETLEERVDTLFDFQFVQRVLPKFHGTADRHDIDALMTFLQTITHPGDDVSPADSWEAEQRRQILDEATNADRFPLTVRKVSRLVNSYTVDGYASYW